MIALPDRLESLEELQGVLVSLTAAQRTLVDRVCSRVYYPHQDSPPECLRPYQGVIRSLQGVPAFREGAEYTHAVNAVYAFLQEHADGVSWGEFGWGMVQYLCLSLAVPVDDQLRTDLLLPLRLVASVPVEWCDVVAESVKNLGLEAALVLPSLTDRPVRA